MEIKVVKDILSANDELARKNRQLLDSKKVFAVNLMSSPGAGKTSLILHTIERLKGKVRVGVIEGDVSSRVDADTVAKEGVPVTQINTDGGCHLDANMIAGAMKQLPLKDIDLLFIENVGNLICPADFLLGAHIKVVISSISEGHDKPVKYPLMFHIADAVLVNKIDLAPYLNFDNDAFSGVIRGYNKGVQIFPVSCTTEEGIDRWTAWLVSRMKRG